MHTRFLTAFLIAFLATLGTASSQTAENALADAVRQGDTETISSLLANGGDPNGVEADGATALHWAVYQDNLEAATLLVHAGADVAVANRDGATALYLACVNGNAGIIELLLDNGADANAVVTEQGETALMLASLTGSAAAVQALLERGAEVNQSQERGQTALMWAASEGHADVLGVLISNGADVGARSMESTREERRPPGGMTALMFASRDGGIDSAKALVDAGANLNQTMADGTSPLVMTIVNGHYELGLYLLNQGANPNIADSHNRAALYAAIDMRNVQWAQGSAPTGDSLDPLLLIKALVGAGADPNAALVGKVNNRGAFDMRWSDTIGATPFVRAAQNGDIEVLQLLLAYGANPFVETSVEETAMHLLGGVGWPLGQGHIRTDDEILASYDLLISLGLDVNAANASGITPLMGAAYKGENVAVQYLVDHGANMYATDDEGRNALAWAEGVLATLAQPRRRQPHTEVLLLELMGSPADSNVDGNIDAAANVGP
jgi:ankyrin repeat protein